MSVLWAQSPVDNLNVDFLSDTITINTDSLTFELMDIHVVDNRLNRGKVFSISSGDKSDTAEFPDSTGLQRLKKVFLKLVYRYIPIDIVYEVDQPIAELFGDTSASNGDSTRNSLVINHLDFWYDKTLPKKSRRILNAQTQLKSPTGEILNEWEWDIHIKRNKKEKLGPFSGRILEQWVNDQHAAIQASIINPISPYPYERMLIGRSDIAILTNGYLVDWRISFAYSKDQINRYRRGLPGFGFTYQKTIRFETFGVGESGKQEIKRLNNRFIGRLTYGYRWGTVRYDWDKFDNLKGEYWPFVKLMATVNAEYRPQFHQGVFAGIGIYQGLNVWPKIIPLSETGLLLSIGVMLR